MGQLKEFRSRRSVPIELLLFGVVVVMGGNGPANDIVKPGNIKGSACMNEAEEIESGVVVVRRLPVMGLRRTGFKNPLLFCEATACAANMGIGPKGLKEMEKPF